MHDKQKTTTIGMPKLSDSMKEGILVAWHVKPGDQVREGDPLADIETDKAVMSFHSPEDGFVAKLFGKEGDIFDLGQDLLTLARHINDLGEKENEPKKEQIFQNQKNFISPSRKISSPLARKLAKEKNLSLENIQGSGPGGRILAKDIFNIKVKDKDEGEFLPLSSSRKVIAERLSEAALIPQFSLSVIADMEAVCSWYDLLKKDGRRASFHEIFVFLVVRALKCHPFMLSSWKDGRLWQGSGISISWARVTPHGLLTPVIHGAENLNFEKMVALVRELNEKSRLSPEESQGGQFTISNLGMMGISNFTPIINPPQAAILALGSIQKDVCVFQEAVTIRRRMHITLACDHRVLDGNMGAEFLKTLLSFFEEPLRTL